MMRCGLLVALATLVSAQTLPPWQPGMLDIHQIANGRGNTALVVMPDGTTLLVDAGGAGDGIEETEPHLAGSASPGAAAGQYIRRRGVTNIDYALITHFHADHMGGLADLYREVPFAKLLDRGWPDYSYPAPQERELRDYRAFLKSSGVAVERFRPGVADQIVPLHGANVEIRNIIGNGQAWTGSGTATRQLFPKNGEPPSENMCSLAIRLTYGAFRWFSGGDLPGTPDPGLPAWTAPEAMIAGVVGPVDAQVVSQHGSMGEAGDAWLMATQSRVFVIPSWAPSHPAPDTLKRIVNGRFEPKERAIFVTDMRPSARTVIGARARQAEGQGHIVVRVEAGGARYSVYVLDNANDRDLVKVVRGPFNAGTGPG